jgi:hypothetical protein
MTNATDLLLNQEPERTRIRGDQRGQFLFKDLVPMGAAVSTPGDSPAGIDRDRLSAATT